MTTSLAFALPSIKALSFLPFLLCQAILLQPAVPARPSSIFRFLLMFPAAYFAVIAPFKYRFEPAELSIGVNFRWGVFGPYFLLKALEWGLTQDRSPYVWIGFDAVEEKRAKLEKRKSATKGASLHVQASTPSTPVAPEALSSRLLKVEASKPTKAVKTEAINTSASSDSSSSSSSKSTSADSSRSPSPPRPDRSAMLRRDIAEAGPEASIKHKSESESKTEHVGIGRIVLNGMHLMTSMRGIGYAYGPSRRVLAKPSSRDPRQFLVGAVRRLFLNHFLSCITLVLMSQRDHDVPYFLRHYAFPIPGLKEDFFRPFSHQLAYFLIGPSMCFQVNIGHELFSIVYVLGTAALRAILPTSLRPLPFDTREWPPMFNQPGVSTSVTHFWGTSWHALFRKPFTACGYEPIVRLLKPLRNKPVSRLAGAFAVFLLSAWLHDQALWSARYGLTSCNTKGLSWSQRNGTYIYFIAQGLAVGFEGVSRGKLRGRLWTCLNVIGFGMVAARSWLTLGVVKDAPRVQDWGWERFLLPGASLAPPLVFIRGAGAGNIALR